MNQDNPDIETAHISLHGNRRYNQDRYAVLNYEDCYLLVLADGLGGHPKGEVAAEYLIHAAELFFPKQFDRNLPIEPFFQLIINHAHRETVKFGLQEVPPIQPRTTAVLALIKDEEVHWGHVGDSRLYLFRNQKVMFRTKDHTYKQELIRRGIDVKTQVNNKNMGALVRCVGGGKNPPTIEMGPLVPLLVKDVLVLCSDGFWGQLDPRNICRAFEDPASLSIILAALGQQALETAFPKSDNVTAVALRKWRMQSKKLKTNSKDSSKVKKMQSVDELDNAIDSLEEFIKKVEQDLKE